MKIIFSGLFFFSIFNSAWSQRNYVNFKLEKGPFNLVFYSAKKIKVIEVNSEGLLIEGKKVCSWPKNKFDPKASYNMVMVKDETQGPCEEVPAIKSIWGDKGIGTAVLTVDFLNLNGNTVMVPYKGSELSLNLENLPIDLVRDHK